LGSLFARHLLARAHRLKLLVHRAPLPFDTSAHPQVSVCPADLEYPATLAEPCRDVDCILHFAGLLFAPRPERFLPRTNVGYVENLLAAARAAGVRKFVLVSFPHVEGESLPERPATGRMDGTPGSVHARTRLLAEKRLFAACEGTAMAPVVLRVGMVYARGVKMIEAARWLLRHRLLAVWRRPTWEHLLALPDFHSAAVAAIEGASVAGVYNLGDDRPVTLQEFLDTLAAHWGFRRPWRLPRWCFPAAGACCEAFAALFGTAAPLTRDFVDIGMASACADTSRMKRELLPRLAYPSLREGLALL
jgi:nucleoside-diphosphate-sugar epimerase